MKIIQFTGTDPSLYRLMAPLVMNAEVLRQNNNYPFKTSPQYTWFIAQENNSIKGFMPVECRNNQKYIINNYYLSEDNLLVLKALLEQVHFSFAGKLDLEAVVFRQHTDVFQAAGFFPIKTWKLYVKMEYQGLNHEEKKKAE
ncbi:MAG: hypothetical protein RRX93_04450 [Bacteroidales bacterium]